ncbi:MAG: putative fatty acid methyltransferase [Acidimicrobiales bacterium]|nr:MAG: class I SAM-dependent methyltransferase [Actinomycetota bacterium]MBV6508331.1 putative fatty acid methyltransferase [Acidimicrobiales bacterium]RIK07112.1 MAG: SAM-dependent methyltransferase [Acidobacteriota bacterium]
MKLQPLIETLIGTEPPIAVRAYDGSVVGPADAPATLVVNSPDALRRMITSPGELGMARAYVAGDIDIEGDIYAVIRMRDRLPPLSAQLRFAAQATRLLGVRNLRPLEPPEQEARLRGRRHSKARDAAAVSHHYDVGNEFYRLFLGPSMTYSCALFENPRDGLEAAQARKYELICQKLGLRPGMRLLDVGCGWGGMAIHAARHHGVSAVGVTLSAEQAEAGQKLVADNGLTGQVEIRLQDYRDVTDGPYDAISSIGMFEHVGLSKLQEYFRRLVSLLGSDARLLNHAISRPRTTKPRLERNSFINRYVFPDGELHEVGTVISALQNAGAEARHMESLRPHYALTLRHWVANLESNWSEALDLVGAARARVWRLYMAGSAVNFETNRTQVHQVLATRTIAGSRPHALPLRPDWSPAPPVP